MGLPPAAGHRRQVAGGRWQVPIAWRCGVAVAIARPSDPGQRSGWICFLPHATGQTSFRPSGSPFRRCRTRLPFTRRVPGSGRAAIRCPPSGRAVSCGRQHGSTAGRVCRSRLPRGLPAPPACGRLAALPECSRKTPCPPIPSSSPVPPATSPAGSSNTCWTKVTPYMRPCVIRTASPVWGICSGWRRPAPAASACSAPTCSSPTASTRPSPPIRRRSAASPTRPVSTTSRRPTSACSATARPSRGSSATSRTPAPTRRPAPSSRNSAGPSASRFRVSPHRPPSAPGRRPPSSSSTRRPRRTPRPCSGP